MSNRAKKIKVAFSVTNCLCHDQRIIKMATLVSGLGCDIILIGRKSGDCCKHDSIAFRTRRFRMIFMRGFLFYMFFNIRLFFYLLLHKCDILVSNDLDTLLPNFLVSRFKKIPVVYDSHEYFTGVPEIQSRRFVKWVWKSIERSIFPRLKYVMTVSDSIAMQYMSEYGLKPLTVRNCSPGSKNIIPLTRAEIRLNPRHLLLIFQGAGINRDRGGEELIDAIAITDNVSLLVIGSGDKYEVLIENASKQGLTDRIRFLPKLPWNDLMRYTKAVDAGLSLDKNSNLNYKYSLPNKLFDYISAGIPVLATELPEITKIVTEYKFGILISEPSAGEISKALKVLRDDRQLLSELKRNSALASESINWENESLKVAELYRSILNQI